MKYFSKNNSLQKDLIELSIFLGNNLDWVQGAGRNTSVKDKSNISVDSFIYQSWMSITILLINYGSRIHIYVKIEHNL